MDKARFVARFGEYWPQAAIVNMQENSRLRREWFDGLGRYPASVVLVAISQIYTEAEYARAPTLAIVARKTNDLWQKQIREKERRDNEVQRATETTITPQEFAEDEGWWAPRENQSDPKEAAFYRMARKQFRAGKQPQGLIMREPGED
jgi:hypothetical protein